MMATFQAEIDAVIRTFASSEPRDPPLRPIVPFPWQSVNEKAPGSIPTPGAFSVAHGSGEGKIGRLSRAPHSHGLRGELLHQFRRRKWPSFRRGPRDD